MTAGTRFVYIFAAILILKSALGFGGDWTLPATFAIGTLINEVAWRWLPRN